MSNNAFSKEINSPRNNSMSCLPARTDVQGSDGNIYKETPKHG
jgi:hypothetical protein